MYWDVQDPQNQGWAYGLPHEGGRKRDETMNAKQMKIIINDIDGNAHHTVDSGTESG